MTINWLTGDVLDKVRGLPDNSVDLVACSPPFLALRDYGGLAGQWGSENNPAEFLGHLLELTIELRRVLAPHGSIAVELGDTYSGSGGAGGDYNLGGPRDGQHRFKGSAKGARIAGWPMAKSLTGTPTLFAWSLAYGRNLLRHPRTASETIRWHRKLMNAGISDASAAYWLDAWPWPLEPHFDPWRIRNVIVWARNNPPVGALADKVRPATSYITVATPSVRRWFDLDAVRGPGSPNTHARTPKGVRRQAKAGKAIASGRGGNWSTLDEIDDCSGSPPLDHWADEYDGDTTWLINTAGSGLAHYAMWPATLAERLVLSMCPREVCKCCGEPRRRITETEQIPTRHMKRRTPYAPGSMAESFTRRTEAAVQTLGWSDCECDGGWRPGHVLDPFAGTGTTLAVADIHDRDATGIDLDPANQDLYPHRYEECWKALKPGTSPVTSHGTQLDLLAI